MIKKITILLAISAALLTSCAVEPVFEDKGPAGTTTVTFTPSFSTGDGNAATKAFADVPQLENLYLAVFNEGGKALIEYVKAEPVTLATGNSTKYVYTATLKTSSKPRVIHFIANAPEEIGSGSDVDALGNLNYSFDTEHWTGDDAYWGYLKLDSGICDENNPGFSSLKAALSGVKLVRNFAKIKVKKADSSNFTITRYWISNFPDCSTAAPYNHEARRFETAYATYSRATAAMAAGYMGFRPTSSSLVSIKGLSESRLDEIQCLPGASAYTYEREKPLSDPLCIIVGGTSDLSPTETFYKIDLRDNDGNYLPILRNFTYTVTVGNVRKVGMPNVEEALNSVASGAIDIDIALQGLKNLSNGKSRIAVSETERMLFDDNLFELLYSFVPDVTTGAVVNTTLEQLGKTQEQAETDHDSYVTIGFESGLAGNVIAYHSISDADETDGYRKVFLNPAPVSDVVKTEVVSVIGHVWNSDNGGYETIQRTVKYQMRKRSDLTLTLTPNEIPEEFTGTIKATIGIEENLPMSLFPLDMKITSDRMTLSPADDNMSMSSGVGADGKPAFFMNRTISWEEYCSTVSVMDGDGIRRKHFDCLLKVNTSDFEDLDESFGKGDRVVVTGDVFNPGSAYLSIGDDGLKRFIKPHLDKGYLVAGRTANIVFGMTSPPSDSKILVMLNGLEPAASGELTWLYDVTTGYYSGFSVYDLEVDNTNIESTLKSGFNIESFAVKSKTGTDFVNFMFESDEFYPSVKYEYIVQKPVFGNLKFKYYGPSLVAGNTAQVFFHMEYLPEDGKATLYLKNAVPADETLTGTGPDTDGYTSYEIDANKNDVSFEVVISPAVGEDKAYFKLSADGFTDSSVIEAPIR